MKYLFGLILMVALTLVSFDAFGCNPRQYNRYCQPYYPSATVVITVPVAVPHARVSGYGYGYPTQPHMGQPHVSGGYPVGYGNQSRYSRFSISGSLGVAGNNGGYYGNRGAAGVGFHYETGKSETR